MVAAALGTVVRGVDGAFRAARRVGLRLVVARFAGRRFAAAFFPPRFAEARDGARRRLPALFEDRRFVDFVERFLEDLLVAAIGFLLCDGN